jgi:hypothetical protein
MPSFFVNAPGPTDITNIVASCRYMFFCGHHLLLAQLKPSDRDRAKGARNVLRRIIKTIRKAWPDVETLIRADSCFVVKVNLSLKYS